jgi:hypothetical protein
MYNLEMQEISIIIKILTLDEEVKTSSALSLPLLSEQTNSSIDGFNSRSVLSIEEDKLNFCKIPASSPRRPILAFSLSK